MRGPSNAPEPVAHCKYEARLPDARGHIQYDPVEDETWQILIRRQRAAVPPVACSEYLEGLKKLELPEDHVPQLAEVNSRLQRCTGWRATAVPALIPFVRFCELLANRQFPCATFIRHREELDYLQEPDIFHEVFGHCAMLTHPEFADFTQRYGALGLEVNETQRRYLERLYWFTVEFGLVVQEGETRIYGGGILSSIGETRYALGSTPERRPFNLVDVLRTPYRIDIMQPIYYVLEDLSQLQRAVSQDVIKAMKKAENLGMFKPAFPPACRESGSSKNGLNTANNRAPSETKRNRA